MGYLGNFIVYTLAMIGVIMFALFIFKYTTGCKINDKSKTKGLKVLDTLSLTPRKTLYVIETDGEKFLIAGDIDRTTLISKLESKGHITDEIPQIQKKYSEDMGIGIRSIQRSPYDSVLKNLAEKIRG